MNLTIDEIRFISNVIHRAQRIIELVVVCALLCDACGRLAGFFSISFFFSESLRELAPDSFSHRFRGRVARTKDCDGAE